MLMILKEDRAKITQSVHSKNDDSILNSKFWDSHLNKGRYKKLF